MLYSGPHSCLSQHRFFMIGHHSVYNCVTKMDRAGIAPAVGTAQPARRHLADPFSEVASVECTPTGSVRLLVKCVRVTVHAAGPSLGQFAAFAAKISFADSGQ